MIDVLWITFPQLETQELKQAMSILGYRPYNSVSSFRNKGHVKAWSNHLLNKETIDFDMIFDGYDVALEIPPMLFYRDFFRKNPHLKVLVLDLDNATNYHRYKRLMRLLRLSAWVKIFKHPRSYMGMVEKMLYFLFKGDDSMINATVAYTHFLDDVKRIIPPQQLLFFKPADGWKPLCDFLQKPVPSQKFPIQHDKRLMNNTTRSILLSIVRRDAIPIIIYILTVISLFVYLIFFY